jgi:dihydrofolate reductase
MRKIIFPINVTLDGYADHTSGIADDELHDFFTEQLGTTDTVLFGRKTYELMVDYWPNAANDPRTTKSELAFSEKYNSIRKIVFSKTLTKVEWSNTTLVNADIVEEVKKLKQQPGDDVFSIGGISAASALLNAGLIDELWILVHPILAGKGRSLFEDIHVTANLKLVETKTFNSGVVVLHYQKN